MNAAPPSRLSARALTTLGAAAAVVYAAAAAPASFIPALAMPKGADIGVARATGTVWKGALEGVRAEGVLIGDIAFRTKPFALLAGRRAADLDISGGALSGNGHVSAGPGGEIAFRDALFVFDLDAATRYAFLGAPLEGTARAEIERLVVSHEGCIDSQARLWTDVLVAPAKRFAAEAFDLEGEGVCDGRDFVVALQGRGGEGAVTLSIRVTPELAYALIAEAQPARTEVAEALRFLGFQQTNGAMTIGAAGTIQSAGS